MRFIVWLLPQRHGWPDTNRKKRPCRTSGIVMPRGKARKTEKSAAFLSARVDTHACVRYAFEFTRLELLHLRGTDKLPHGRRKASYSRTRFFGVVQPTGPQGAARGLRAGPGLHDRAALRMGAVGKHPTSARPPV